MMGRGGGGGGLIGFLAIEEVRKELEMLDDQVEAVQKMGEELRAQMRAERENQEGGERPDYRNMSEEERQKFMEEMRKRGEERNKVIEAKLGEILLPHQVDRLKQIALQQAGVGALMNPEVTAKLGLSDAQKEKIQAAMQERGSQMRERMQEIFRGEDRENMREKFEALRKEMDEKVLALLTVAQKEELEKLKGKPFEMPQRRFGGGRGGPGGDGPRGGGENRPQRPQRPGI
jgi:hypothetical protein